MSTETGGVAVTSSGDNRGMPPLVCRSYLRRRNGRRASETTGGVTRTTRAPSIGVSPHDVLMGLGCEGLSPLGS